jgi:hypothetical protein
VHTPFGAAHAAAFEQRTGGLSAVERPVHLDAEAALGEIDAAARSLFERMGYRVEERWPITD